MAIPLVRLSEKRDNIVPLVCDAGDIDYLEEKIGEEKIDTLFCDIPSGNQVDILIKASELVDKDCKILFSLKTQSISQDEPKKTFEMVEKRLRDVFEVKDVKSLEPHHKKHWFFVLRKK